MQVGGADAGAADPDEHVARRATGSGRGRSTSSSGRWYSRMIAAFIVVPRPGRERGHELRRYSRCLRIARSAAAGRRSRIARWISPCWRRIASPSIESPIVSISEGCSTSSVQLVKARRSSFRAARRDHAVEARVGDPERLRGGVVALGLGDRREQLRRGALGRVPGRQAGERHLERQARGEQLVQRDAVGLEHRRDRLADVAAHSLVLRALDEDAAARPARGPDQVRAREQAQPLAQRRPADPELRRELLLGPEALTGPEPARREIPADLERDLLARVPARQAEARSGRQRHGEKVSSGATLTSSRSGSARSPRPGSTSSSVCEQARRGRRSCAPGSRRRARGPATSTSTVGQGPRRPAARPGGP